MNRSFAKIVLATFLWMSLAAPVLANQSYNFGSTPSGVTLIDQDWTGVTLEVNVGRMDFHRVETTGGVFTLISIPGFSRSHNIGEPNLPLANRLLSIPFGSELKADIISAEFEEISLSDLGVTDPLMPTQPSLSKSEDPEMVPFRFSRSSYQQSGYYALPLGDAQVLGIMRSVNIGRVSVSPVQYDPIANRLKVYKRLTVKVNYLHPDFYLTRQMQEECYSIVFEPVYERIINYETPTPDIMEDLVTYPIKYVIVSDREFEDQLQPFIEWKTKKGFNVIVGYTDEIGHSNTEIKNFIRDIYQNSNPPTNPRPSFVLLVGDTPEIPPFNGTAGYHVTDLPFCEFTNDVFPEIYYGRFSAQNTTELIPQIEKTLEFEQLAMPDFSYLEEVTMISGVDAHYAPTYGNGQINYGTNLYFNAAHGITSHTWLYPESANPGASGAIIATVNEGIGYINYTAHCSRNGFGDPSFTVNDINNLTNEHMYLLGVGNCCSSNDFEGATPCFGEAWLQANGKGGVGYIGATNSTYWDEDYWWGVGNGPIVGSGPTYEETGLGAYDGVFHDHNEPDSLHYITNDAMIFCGNMAVTEAGGMVTYYWETYHLMGDPSVMNYMGIPAVNNIQHDGAIPLVATYFTVHADPGSYVGLTKDGVSHGAGYVDSSGYVDVPIDPPFDEPGYADLVVTCQNRIPYDVQVPIIAEGYGCIAGRVTDLVTGDGLQGRVIVTNRDPQIVSQCNQDGYYLMHVPADTLWDLRAEYTSDYLPSFAQVSVPEDDTVTQNFELEPKVQVILKASFGNPEDIAYRTFYFRGSWDDDGFYNAGWDCSFSPMRDDGVAPDEVRGDGIFTGSILLATDQQNTYEWAVYSENYNDDASRLQYGASFQITNPANPPQVPTLSVNPSGHEHNWTLSCHDTNFNVEFDLTPGYNGQPHIWYGTHYIPRNWTVDYIIRVMHSDVAGYGDGGVGGIPISFTPAESGNYTFYFNDSLDVVSTGGNLIPRPGWVSVELESGGTTSREVTLINNGELDLNFQIPDDFEETVLNHNGNKTLPEPGPYTSYVDEGPKPDADVTVPGMPVVDGRGGPDEYGYRWVDSDEPDGPEFEWVDISGIGTPISLGDDQNAGPYSLPFTFSFYGNDFNSFRVCSNGWISFTSTSTSYSNSQIPSASAPDNLIAPMWDDLNPSTGGQVYYYTSNDTAIVAWEGVPHYYNSGSYTFEIIMPSGGAIVFQYLSMQGTLNSATVGIQNQDGSDGLQVVYNSDYIHDSLAVKFTARWLEVSPLSGVIPAGGQVPLTFDFDAGTLELGQYEATVRIDSWDILHSLPQIEMPVTLDVVQSVGDLHLAMAPDNPPVEVRRGGSFDYTLAVTNNTGSQINYEGWLMVELPNHNMFGPIAQANTSIGANATQYLYLTQDVPYMAPAGNYGFWSYVGDYPSTIIDDASFPFRILAETGGEATDWNVYGFFSEKPGEGIAAMPTSFELAQNYPNPFNAGSVIGYGLPQGSHVQLNVYNLLGQKVETLVDKYQEAGYHSVTWNASNYASGIYFYKLEASGKRMVKQMTLVK